MNLPGPSTRTSTPDILAPSPVRSVAGGRHRVEQSKTAQGSVGDTFIGVVFGVLASSNLLQGAWIEEVPWLNITTASFVLAPLAAMAGLRRRHPLPGVFALLILLTSLSLGFIEPAASGAGEEKRINLVIGVAAVSVFSFLALTTAKRLRAFFATLVLLALIGVAAQWLNPDPSALITGRRTPEGLNAIGVARLIGAGLTVVAAWGLGRKRRRGLALLLSLPLVAGLAAAESRGPALGTGVALVLLLLLHASLRVGTKIILMALVVPLLYLTYTALLESGSRLTDFTSTGRLVLYETGLQVAVDHPVGVGWGNFYRYVPPALLNSGQGENLYVHNILLEFLVESGAVGALLFLAFVIFIARWAVNADASFPRLVLICLATNLFVGALLSSDVVGNRMLWVVLSAILALPSSRQVGPVLASEQTVSRLTLNGASFRAHSSPRPSRRFVPSAPRRCQ